MKLFAVACMVAASFGSLAAQEVYRPGNGVTTPVVIREVKPEYTEEAKKAHVAGGVILSAVVAANGDVTDVTVTRSLDTTFGLDQQAVKAAKEWKFKPGTKDGKAVPVRIELQMTFTLK